MVMAWVPILLRFVRSWRERRNPVSLAICGLIIYVQFLSLSVAWVVDGSVGLVGLLSVHGLLCSAACVNFYAAFRRARHHFRERRSGPS